MISIHFGLIWKAGSKIILFLWTFLGIKPVVWVIISLAISYWWLFNADYNLHVFGVSLRELTFLFSIKLEAVFVAPEAFIYCIQIFWTITISLSTSKGHNFASGFDVVCYQNFLCWCKSCEESESECSCYWWQDKAVCTSWNPNVHLLPLPECRSHVSILWWNKHHIAKHPQNSHTRVIA